MVPATKTAVENLAQRCLNHEPFASSGTRSPPYTKSSSKTKGIEIAKANGHPTIAPRAKNKVAAKVRLLFLIEAGSREYENANAVVYIVKEDGRKANGIFSKSKPKSNGYLPVEAFHIPALKSIMKNK